MHKVRKQFILYAVAAVAVLLAVLLTVINGVNFTMASEDADRVTSLLAEGQGSFGRPGSTPPVGEFRRIGPMGPDSPELTASIRYFTYAFDENGRAERVAFALSAVDETEAESWARQLLTKQDTGWTRTTYRYRIYEADGRTFVTVIDQGRELLPSYRILIISVVGGLLAVLISYLVLRVTSEKLFHPLEEADRRQKRFIADAEKAFQVPLTVIHADVELLERAGGASEETRSIDRQVRQMTGLVKDLGALAIFEEVRTETLDLGALVRDTAAQYEERFRARGLVLRVDAETPVPLQGNREAMEQLVRELLDNALQFSLTKAAISVTESSGRVTLRQTGDTDLPEQNAERIFDRFIRLENAGDTSGVGLGLWRVKEIVRAHNGRQSARIRGGEFLLEIDL
ncbi:MAG: HAMP domain-containing histidine kinase [Ruminococcaceae bacterium]|nr:HAMP domain-containing histidine kinase [Oscillospiraceae bacterium]